ncbi:MAG: hypothetical protein ACJ8GV_05810 [Luteimonas sp.]
MELEGRYALTALVTPTVGKPGRFTGQGGLHLDGDPTPVETVLAGDNFETPEVAEVAAIEAARQVAATRDAVDRPRPA